VFSNVKTQHVQLARSEIPLPENKFAQLVKLGTFLKLAVNFYAKNVETQYNKQTNNVILA